ncbi:MAG: gamma-glutamyltransferase family protein [Pseudomonadota bacterium]
MRRTIRTLAKVSTAVLTLLAAPHATAQDARATPEAATGRSAKPLVTATRHMVVAANPHASAAGLAVLDEGGSAADAAIASLLVLNVVEPQSSGLGGGAFALVHDPARGEAPLTTYDARETAPALADERLFLGPDGEPLGFWDAVASGRSTGVPGLGRLLGLLHEKHGRLPWARLVAPAERLARVGFAVSPRLAGLTEASAERLAGTDAAAVFLPGGRPLVAGETLRQPQLAETLARLATGGPDVLYGWPVGAAIVSATRDAPMPGQLTLADMRAYRVIERAPVCHRFRTEWRVCGMGPPSSGATTVGQILGLYAAFPPATGARRAHLVAEASRLAYADRAMFLGDPDQVTVPVRGLLDRVYLTGRARLIDPGAAAEDRAEAGDPPERDARLRAPDRSPGTPGTTHLSVVDGDGLALSITASIETAFGSKRMAGGLLLNNQLTDFSFRPTGEDGAPVANAPASGKRPRSSMAPTMVYRIGAPERPVILTGSPGGSRIPEYVVTSLLALLEEEADPAAAAAAPHVSHRNRGALALEAGAHPPGTAEALAELGHAVEEAEMTSGLHIIRLGPAGLEGGADPRREGAALGN